MKKSLLIIAGIIFLAICAFQFVGSTPVSATDQPVIQTPAEDDSAPAEEGEEAVEGEAPEEGAEEGAMEEEPAEEEAPEEEIKDSGDQG